MRRWSGVAVAEVCSWLILSTECRADQVTLKNGTQISGQIVKKEGDTLSLNAPPIGKLRVPWAEVSCHHVGSSSDGQFSGRENPFWAK